MVLLGVAAEIGAQGMSIAELWRTPAEVMSLFCLYRTFSLFFFHPLGMYFYFHYIS